MINLSDYISGYSRYSDFIKLCSYTQEELYKTLHTTLELMKYNVYTNEQDGSKYIYATHSSEPINITLIAHLDTMFSNGGKNIVCTGNLISSPQGLGADDRAGVYGILQVIKKYKCNVLFVCDEEYGQKGSKNFVRSPYFDEFTKTNNFLISLDLSGKNRMKFYDTTNKDFINAISKITNFKIEDSGTHIADLSILVKGYKSDTTGAEFDGCGLAGVNLCCGYKNEHHLNEYIDMDVLNNTINITKTIIAELKDKKFYSIDN
jgi:putative aminopeptidase FrvX